MDIEERHQLEEEKRRLRQQEALLELHMCCSEENLWRCVVAFERTQMRTASGLPFQYKLKVGRNGRFTKELWVDRREDSKSLAWSSVKLAFRSLSEAPEPKLVERPKALGDIRGVSYIYAIFYRFGLLEVPDRFREKMKVE